MKVINATLRKKTGLFTISYHNGVIDAIEPQAGLLTLEGADVINAKQQLLCRHWLIHTFIWMRY